MENIEKCELAETFKHGEFVIDKDGQLGTLLEVTGKCDAAPDDASPLVKLAAGRAVHVAVRGVPDADLGTLMEHFRTKRR